MSYSEALEKMKQGTIMKYEENRYWLVGRTLWVRATAGPLKGKQRTMAIDRMYGTRGWEEVQ